MKKNRFAPLAIPFGLMILFGSLNWIGLTLVCCTIFFSGVFVVCIQSLIESILTSRGMTPEEQEAPPEEGHEVK